jgi:hypothetical protein
MPDRHRALYCDEDVSVVLAAMLRARGFAVTTARDADQLGRSDEEQLTLAVRAGSALLTHNRATSNVSTVSGSSQEGIMRAL